MQPNNFDALDQFIDTALRDDPIRPVPFGFGAAVANRVRAAAMLRRQRRHMRQSLAALFLGALVVIAGAAATWQSGGEFLSRVPGGLGYVDYWSVQMTGLWPGIAASAVLLLFGLTASAVLLETRLRRRDGGELRV